jgi:hypothetical protein
MIRDAIYDKIQQTRDLWLTIAEVRTLFHSSCGKAPIRASPILMTSACSITKTRSVQLGRVSASNNYLGGDADGTAAASAAAFARP